MKRENVLTYIGNIEKEITSPIAQKFLEGAMLSLWVEEVDRAYKLAKCARAINNLDKIKASYTALKQDGVSDATLEKVIQEAEKYWNDGDETMAYNQTTVGLSKIKTLENQVLQKRGGQLQSFVELQREIDILEKALDDLKSEHIPLIDPDTEACERELSKAKITFSNRNVSTTKVHVENAKRLFNQAKTEFDRKKKASGLAIAAGAGALGIGALAYKFLKGRK